MPEKEQGSMGWLAQDGSWAKVGRMASLTRPPRRGSGHSTVSGSGWRQSSRRGERTRREAHQQHVVCLPRFCLCEGNAASWCHLFGPSPPGARPALAAHPSSDIWLGRQPKETALVPASQSLAGRVDNHLLCHGVSTHFSCLGPDTCEDGNEALHP